jgi:hypothetical protein
MAREQTPRPGALLVPVPARIVGGDAVSRAPSPGNAKRDKLLRAFGLRVLTILEKHKDWNSDTMAEIELAAWSCGLANVDRNGMFRAVRRVTP